MSRTTISLGEHTLRRLQALAEGENRSMPNLIETILKRYLETDLYADEYEIENIQKDKTLKKDVIKSMEDYKKGRGRFV